MLNCSNPKGCSVNILGFVWGDMPDFDFNFEELLNSFSEEDILADLAIIGLGERNNDFSRRKARFKK